MLSFVFSHILASFPRFFVFSRASGVPPPDGSNAAAYRRYQRERVRGQKARILPLGCAFHAQFGVRFEFVFTFVLTRPSLFSTTWWLRSYHFLFFQMPGFPEWRGVSRPRRPSVGPQRLPTTICPHKDHDYRLSSVPGVVKGKMGKKRAGLRQNCSRVELGQGGAEVNNRMSLISANLTPPPGPRPLSRKRVACLALRPCLADESSSGGVGEDRFRAADNRIFESDRIISSRSRNTPVTRSG